jgi:hypothetical protein
MRAVSFAGDGPLYDGSMKKKTLRFGKGFRVMRGNHASQAAEMVLPPPEALSSFSDARSTR